MNGPDNRETDVSEETAAIARLAFAAKRNDDLHTATAAFARAHRLGMDPTDRVNSAILNLRDLPGTTQD